MQELRQMAQFEALPPVEAVALAGPASHRYVRQDDPLWSLLHEGVLTTGRVRAALGLYERTAAKKIGIPNGRVGHSDLLHAYHHLHRTARDGAGDAAIDAATAAAAAAHNAAAVLAFNASKLQASGAAETARCGVAAAAAAACGSQQMPQDPVRANAAGGADQTAAAPGSAPTGQSRHARRRLRKKQEQAAGRAAAAPAGQAQLPPAGSVSEEQKLRKARALGSLGLPSICCSWGSAQEAAALVQVAAAFPHSQLAEVGLCRLQEELLPPSWGFGPGSLPPIGASPDALIRHRLPSGPAGQAGAPSGCANGEASASAGNAAAGGAGLAASTAAQAVEPWDIDGLLARLQLAGSEDTTGSGLSSVSSSGGGAAGSGGSGTSSSSVPISCSKGGYLIEVVEVKNTCPFGHSRRGGRLRTSEFAVADRGPRQAVPPEWVPQLQLHMLCAGTQTGLLVSRSVTKGTRIFRMHRDDELLRLMLQGGGVISRLWVHHVLPGRPPPADVFASWHVHHDMLRRIGEAARGAQLVLALEEGVHMPEGDRRWFLD